jgi:hypothetical protein
MFHDAFGGGVARRHDPRHAQAHPAVLVVFLYAVLLLAIGVAALTVLRPVPALSQGACKSEAEILSIADRVGGALHRLDRVATAAAVLFYDSIPPESSSDADTAALVHLPDGSGVILIGKGGTYCANAPIPAGYWRSVVDAILGARS